MAFQERWHEQLLSCARDPDTAVPASAAGHVAPLPT